MVCDFQIQWYPGHMAKARRELLQQVKQVDFVVEVADARAPESTRNPEIDQLIKGRPRLLLLTKADLAEPGVLASWVQAFRRRGVETVAASLLDGRDAAALRGLLRSWVERESTSKRLKRAAFAEIPGVRMPRSTQKTLVRGLVVGIPNTGKSTLIRAIGGKGVRVGAKAGVTRGLQWVNAGEGVQLLDTPGLLWPRLETGLTALKLAWLGCVGDAAFDHEEAALRLVEWFLERDPGVLAQRYELVPASFSSPRDALSAIAKSRGLLLSGGEPDLLQAAEALLWDLRRGRLGLLGLDGPAH